jgi:hypothetical protein
MANEPRSYFSIKEKNEPGLDTWTPSTNFLQVGFRPGYSLQARELIEIQSIIQNQISVFAQEIGYLHGSLAKICESDPRFRDYVDYGDGSYEAKIQLNPSYFFLKHNDRLGYFVRYKYSQSAGTPVIHTPTWSISNEPNDQQTEVVFFGMEYEEQTITPEDDMILYDNATGFPNFNAPGAVRYKLDVKLDLVVKNVYVNTVEGDEDHHQRINNAVVNDFDGYFASSNFIPLFYWTKANHFRILHTNKPEYDLQYELDGQGDETDVPQTMDRDGQSYYVYFKIGSRNVPNIELLEVGGGLYEYCI